MNWSEQAAPIKAIILDIDGVLTNGLTGYTDTGHVKFFNMKDGHAIKMALRQGLLVGVLSGRDDEPNKRRIAELGMSFAYEGQKDKSACFDRLLSEHNLTAEECLYVGDDVVDLPVIRRAGIGVCVADAAPELVPYSDYRTEAGGGMGAVREVIFRVLDAQGKLDAAMAKYLA